MSKRFAYGGDWTTCPDCGEPIEFGDPIAIVGDLTDRHVCCDPCAELHDDEDPDY